MIYLTSLTKINDSKYSIGEIWYMPFDSKYGLGKTQEELEIEGYLINKTQSDVENEIKQFKINNPSPFENYEIMSYFNPSTKEFIYEYLEVEINNDDIAQQIKLLQEENAQITYILMMEGII